MLSSFAQRFRIVVAMWIFVGFGGSLMVAFFGIMAVTGTGIFQEKASFAVDSEFAPGQEVPTDAVRPGGIMVLAYPETVDLSTVECTTKSRVYTTGKRDIGTVVAQMPEGVAPVLGSLESTPRRFVPVADVEWMGTDFISCTGAEVKSFALTSTKGINTDGYRYGVGVFLLVFSPVLFGLGFLALHMTRTWSRQAAQPAYPQPAHPQPPYDQQGYPPRQPGRDPYLPR